MMKRRGSLLALLSLSSLPWASTAAAVDPRLVADLRRLRSLAENTASMVKTRYSDISVEYIESRRRYAIARGEVEGLLGYIKQSLLNGSLSQAAANTYLKGAMASAEKHAREFFDYAARNIPDAAPKSGLAGLAVLGEAVKIVTEILQGWGAANNIQADITAARQKEAADLEQDLRWLSWPDIPPK